MKCAIEGMKDSKEVDIEKDPRALRYFNSFLEAELIGRMRTAKLEKTKRKSDIEKAVGLKILVNFENFRYVVKQILTKNAANSLNSLNH